MTVSINTAPISPLRQRMQHDVMMRASVPHPEGLRAPCEAPDGLSGASPGTVTEHYLRRFQIM